MVAPALLTSPARLAAMKHVPVLVIQGDKDALVPAQMTRFWVGRMKALKMKHKYIEVPGGDHVKPAYQKIPQTFEFFNEHRKK